MNQELNKPAFSATKKELFAALATYAAAYIYAAEPISGLYELQLPVFALIFAAAVEYLCAGKPRAWESWVWLACMVSCVCAYSFGECAVWGGMLTFIFAHIFAVWWAMSRAGVLLGGESGHFLPLDALNGFIILPFGSFFLRVKTWWYFVSKPRREGKRLNVPALVGSIFAVALAALILAGALGSLGRADLGFGEMLSGITAFFGNNVNFVNTFFSFLLSLPIGAYVFGLISGSARMSAESLSERRELAESALRRIRIVPVKVWCVCLGVFIAVYALFFALQGGYLFGAFSRTLPENMSVAEYARQGFFELCRVMALNFVLLWLAVRMSDKAPRKCGASRALCVVLLVESVLFAVVALSKLALYIDCFGFTPLRLQSTWLVLVLLAGCAAAGYSLLTGRKSCRAWMIFGAVTLSALCFV